MPNLQSDYSAIFLSPHLDDAALSCGGCIAGMIKRGESVLVATFTTGDPPPGPLSPLAQTLHGSWSLGRDAVERRRAEDRNACAILGAEFIHLPIPDCIYRRVRGPLGWCYPSHADIFGPVHPDDGERVGELAELLSALPAGRRLFAPLAIGGHVDHVLVRRAVETGFRPALTYYADQPYCARDPGPLAELRARADWIEESDVLDDESLAIKLDAVRAYASQAPKLYPGGFDEGSPARASLEVESFWRKG